ncbi:uncharacterized protein ARMOST_18539 [Armillaria ostoyae]|uniref:Protein kinase domain-containing protein n=1 Tax=Armillaria ostoyae TaxID=47428 RepID=A0A284S267_ARMOS|nr:uncharacterized protein ARMOST_18539 [Armillaria ostoyae]
MADSDVDLYDRDALRAYYEELNTYCQSNFAPIHRDLVNLPAPFAVNGGSYNLDIAYAIRPFRHEKQLSQVWVADVFSSAKPTRSLGKVILKIVQPSLIPLPNLDSEFDEYLRPWEVSMSEDEAYKELKSLQGSTVPYYYGMHTVIMPNEEDADVLIMEYVEGKSLEDWLSERPEHTNPEDLGDKDAEYVEETKRMFKKTLTSIYSINKLGVAYRRINPSNIILTPDPSGTPVFIDFALTVCHVDVKDIRRRYRNDLQVICPLRDCCEQHLEVMANWVKEELAKPEETWIQFDVDESSETSR